MKNNVKDLRGQFAPQGVGVLVQQESLINPPTEHLNVVHPPDGSDLPLVITLHKETLTTKNELPKN